MREFAYGLSRIETAKSRIEGLRRQLDHTANGPATVLGLMLDCEIFEAEKLINVLREHIRTASNAPATPPVARGVTTPDTVSPTAAS